MLNNITEGNVVTNDSSQKNEENIIVENKVIHEDATENNIIKFPRKNPEIQEHTLKLNTNDVVTLYADDECVKLIIENSYFNCGGKIFGDSRIVRKTKKGYFFCLRVIYKDALQILKKLGYKKQTEHIRVSDKDGDSARSYYIEESWLNKKHNALFDGWISISNI